MLAVSMSNRLHTFWFLKSYKRKVGGNSNNHFVSVNTDVCITAKSVSLTKLSAKLAHTLVENVNESCIIFH